MTRTRSLVPSLGPSIVLLATAMLAACGGSSSPAPSQGGGGGGSTPPPPVLELRIDQGPSLTIQSGTAVGLTASYVSGNSGDAQWSVSCEAADCGSLLDDTTQLGRQATYYFAPASGPASVKVTATVAGDAGASATTTINLTPVMLPSPVLPDGAYVFRLSGTGTGAQPLNLAGAFTVSGGIIVAGELDYATAGHATSFAALIASQCMLSGVGDSIQIVLATGDETIGDKGVVRLRGAAVSAVRVVLSLFGTFASGSGTLDLQAAVPPVMGGYAFEFSGMAAEAPVALGGVLNFSGGSLDTAASVFDSNDARVAGPPLSGQHFSSGSASAPDAFGRVEIHLEPSTNSGVSAQILVGYINADQIYLLASTTDASVGGAALAQRGRTGTFAATSASVAGATYVFIDDAAAVAGSVTLNPDGTVGGYLTTNDLGSANAAAINGGTYAVEPTGRVSLRNVAIGGVSLNFQLYLDGATGALELGRDASNGRGGLAYLRGDGGGGCLASGRYAVSARSSGRNNGDPGWSTVGIVGADDGSLSGHVNYIEQLTSSVFAPFADYDLAASEDPEAAGAFSAWSGLGPYNWNYSRTYVCFRIDQARVLAMEMDTLGRGSVILEMTE